ncbi:MAG: glycoside hydrolase family 43 protein [Lachnospiraceae bacterium]|nr:glycoside hydrolase family 43 protein [Lachnospiraceae bacterium]
MSKKCSNPILPGFYPDPSICRAGKDYYLVTSSFTYFPGVPVFHSRDLANWEQIGHVLNRESQLPLVGLPHSEGIYAPTIRYHNGVFYMITTNMPGCHNFLVTAKHPEGPWSDPFDLGPEAKGIDPSLFFDDDGTCYYVGQRERTGGGTYNGDCEIWLRRLNLETMQLEGGESILAYGYSRHAIWPEGPHLYKIGEYYYLMHAEGGTAEDHCEMIARSKQLRGPYEYKISNPILTHRHLGSSYPISCVGHADLVDDGEGNWYLVTLACRPSEGHTLMGRETFLAKVVWENDWPVVSPGTGVLQDELELPGDEDEQVSFAEACGSLSLDFKEETLPVEMTSLREPLEEACRILPERGVLQLELKRETIRDEASPSYLCVHQHRKHFMAETEVQLQGCAEKEADVCAGLVYMQNNSEYLQLTGGMVQGKPVVRVRECVKGREKDLAVINLEHTAAPGTLPEGTELRLHIDDLKASCFWRTAGTKDWQKAAEEIDLRHMSTESCWGFTGCTVGLYASANGTHTEGCAEFKKLQIAEDR